MNAIGNTLPRRFKAKASGSITAGKPLIVEADGDVAQVGESAVSASLGTAVSFVSNSGDTSVAYDSTNNKILVAYKDDSNNKGMAVVGTISGTSISFGTAAEFAGTIGGSGNRRIGICFNSTEGKFVIVYRDSSVNNYGRAITATISGTSVSFGTSAVFSGSSVTNYQACSFDSGSNRVVIAYSNDSDGGDGYGVIAKFSGTSLTFGTAVEFESGSLGASVVPIYDSNANKTVIIYSDGGNSLKGTAIVATVSDTTISYGSSVLFENAQTEHQSGAFDSANNKIVVCYADSGNSGYGTAIVGTVSGTSISFGTATVFESASAANAQMQAAFNVAAGKTVIGYRDAGNSNYGTYVEVTITSGTSMSFSTPAVFESAIIDNTPAVAAYDSSNKAVVFAYQDEGNSNAGTAIAYSSAHTATNLASENFIGFAEYAAADTKTATVLIKGGVSTTQSSLTPGQTYFVQSDGTINTPTSVVNFDIASGSFTQAFSVSSQDTSPSGLAFNPDGTKMFVVGNTGDDVNEYTLSTGFDVSTASFVDSFSVNAQQAAPMSVAFNTDGTKMYIVGETEDTVAQYALSTGFDVSTASYTQAFSISSQETEAQGITFNTDGTKMFVVGDTGNDINEYTLSTGFDVSSASFVDSFSFASQSTQPKEAVFNTLGTELFMLARDNTAVFKYTLTTAFDVSTASYASVSFSVDSQESSPQGLAFSADGSKMYVCGDNGDDINQYATTSTVTNSSTVTAGTAVTSTKLIVKG